MEVNMWKYLLLIQSQLRDHKEMRIFFGIELFIAIVALNIVFADFKEVYQKKQIYNQLELENMVCFTSKQEDALEIGRNKGEILWYSKISEYTTTEDTVNNQCIKIDFLTKELAEGLKYSNIEGEWVDSQNTSVPQAIIPQELSKKYRIGHTYTVNEIDEKQKITFKVVGVLKNNCMFYLPNDSYGSLIGSDYHNILIYSKENRKNHEVNQEPVFLAKFKDKDTLNTWILESGSVGEIKGVQKLHDAWEEERTYQVGELIVPGLVGGVVFILCIVGMISFNLLTTVSKEKCYGIFYLNGATKKVTYLIQIVTDIVPVFSAMVFSQIVLFWTDVKKNTDLFSKTEFVFSSLVCLIVMIIAAYISISGISKKNPINIIEKW
jgi:hypothetical protein